MKTSDIIDIPRNKNTKAKPYAMAKRPVPSTAVPGSNNTQLY